MQFHRRCGFFLCCLLTLGGTFTSTARAQAVAPRIKGQIVDKSRVTLRGHTLPSASLGRVVGIADDAARADRLLLVLRRSPEHETALRIFLDSLQDPRSPNYRQFLTPEQFGNRFGAAASDLNQIIGWLRAHGFQVAGVNKGHTAIEFSGTIGQLQEAFQVPIRRYTADGVEHWANASDPSVPAALAPLIAGIANLNDFKPQSMAMLGPHGAWNESAQRIKPQLTTSLNNEPYLFITPSDAATVYNSPVPLNGNIAPSQTRFDGTGVTIGVVGNVDPDSSAISNYRALFGLSSGHWTIVRDGDPENFDQSADPTEALLDSEVSGGLAPGANVILYTAGDTLFQSGLVLAIDRAIDDNTVGILSVSFGACEENLGSAGNLQILQEWEQAAAQGIAVTVAAGDSGSAGCDNFNTEQAAQYGLAVNGFASTPYNIAVGGTDFDVLDTGFANYVSSSNSPYYRSALKYIPENPWNNSTSANGTLSANTPLLNSKGLTNIVAGSGGPSSVGAVDGSGNPIPYSKPQWQQNFLASNQDTVRDLPDVSLFSGSGLHHALWAVCESDDCSGGAQWTITGVGGTSGSAPAFAGILALVNQAIGASNRLGQPNWILYRLAQTAPSVFHQITTGNNSVYCLSGSPQCGPNNFLSGFNAVTAYNFATGLGTVDASNLVNNWGSIALTSTTTALNLDQTTFVHGTSVNITATVTPSDSTGDVAIVNNLASQSTGEPSTGATRVTLQGGTAAGTFDQFPGGKYNVFATYGGDASHAGSTSQPISVNITPESSILNLFVDAVNSQGRAANAAGQTWPLGTFVSMNAQPIGVSQSTSPNPIANATGTASIYDSFNGQQGVGDGMVVLGSNGIAEWNVQTFQAGAHTITAYYSGDQSYNASVSSTVNFNVAPAPTSISLSSDVSTLFSGNVNLIASVAASVVPQFDMHGTVTFTNVTNNTVLGTSSILTSCALTTTECGITSLAVYVNQLAIGANTITATYGGDPNFLPSGPSAVITVTCTAGCSNGTGQTLQFTFYPSTPNGPLSSGQSSTTPVGVTPGGGFTGAVKLTCSVTGKNPADVHVPTCSFNPAQISIAGSDMVESSLILNTTAPTSSSIRRARSAWAPAATLFALLFIGVVPGAKRWSRIWLSVVLLAFISLCISACGGGGGGAPTGGGGGTGGGGTTVPGTTADTYTVTFHAADAATGTVTAQDYYTFIVQ
jgi:subtilase family serine protease